MRWLSFTKRWRLLWAGQWIDVENHWQYLSLWPPALHVRSRLCCDGRPLDLFEVTLNGEPPPGHVVLRGFAHDGGGREVLVRAVIGPKNWFQVGCRIYVDGCLAGGDTRAMLFDAVTRQPLD
ncbi:hypothetical protein BA022_08830 [Diaphorobacter nitroreducens]|uniref:hypothetical protein n=1 Tax=Diaphorobacter nitroreducens TaxID=164759 RepID=UPI000B59F9D9|nr:hypothetical protein [Diaphorobacter nitroreducens]ASI68640.1 hypothetical protein BA022_08830 [Diaphorobacter nitroreducens]